MKICIVISTISSGGAERNACLLANHFSKDNDVVLFTYQKSNKNFYNFSSNIKIKNLNLLTTSNNFIFKFVNFIKRLYVIYSNLKKQKPDVLLSFLETTNITVIIASLFVKNIKLKIISDRNNPNHSENKVFLYLLKFFFYRFTNYLVLQSNKIKENYKFLKKSKIKIISNTLSSNIKKKGKYIISKKLKIISVGRLETQKGYDILLKSLNLLKKKNINFSCDIYGVGSKKKSLLKNIEYYDLKKQVFLKGVTKKILKIYKNYDLYILSSIFEGYPNSLLEALSSGVACISSNCNYGPSEIIKNKFNGLLFKNKDSEDLSRKIFFLIKKKNKFKYFSKNSKKKFEFKKYNKDKILKWENLIKIK